MATVKEINHDSSTTIGVHYDTVTDSDGAITVAAPFALDGSTYGIEMDYDAGTSQVVLQEDFTALTGDDFRWRIRLDLSNMANATSTLSFANFYLRSGSTNIYIVQLTTAAGPVRYQLNAFYYNDSGVPTGIGANQDVDTSGEICIEVRAVRESADGAADGIGQLYVNGVLQSGSKSNAENFNKFSLGIDRARIEFPSNDANIVGQLIYDEWILDDISTADLGCNLTDLSLAAMTKPADIDAAGNFIYVALLEGGTPILTKISTALSADGTTVFNPGAGTNIGVECGRFNSDVIWVAGALDGLSVVEKSEDGGTTFTAKDDGTIGDVRTFVMGPDSDERILVFDETNGDILETIDDGATWTAINAAVTPEVNAIARFGKNVQEAVFGNDGGANNSINYSVNSGGNLQDFQTGVYPNQNATRVIVN
jgi:hypothetical protein